MHFLPFSFDLYEPVATHLSLLLRFRGETLPPPRDSNCCRRRMWTQSCFPSSQHLFFSLLFAFSPAAPPRKHSTANRGAAFQCQPTVAHTDVHAHLKLCERTFTAGLRAGTPAWGKCTESCASTCSFGQGPLMALLFWWVSASAVAETDVSSRCWQGLGSWALPFLVNILRFCFKIPADKWLFPPSPLQFFKNCC